MRIPPLETRIRLLAARLQRYDHQYWDLGNDIVAAHASGADDADEVVAKLEQQREEIERAHAAIEEVLEEVSREYDSVPGEATA